jgi:predicted MFS family arabinose efflux permease
MSEQDDRDPPQAPSAAVRDQPVTNKLAAMCFMAWGALLVLLMLWQALGPPWWGIALLQAAFGLTFFMFHGTMQTQSTEVLPDARGTAVALFVLSLFLGQTVGAVVMGAVLGAGGYAAVFWVAAGMMVGVAGFAGRVRS